MQKAGAVAYQLEIPPHYRLHNTFHVSLLKPAYDNHAGIAPILVEGEDEFLRLKQSCSTDQTQSLEVTRTSLTGSSG